MNTAKTNDATGRRTTNMLLAAIAVLLGVQAVDRAFDPAVPLTSVANAASEPETTGLISAGEQRKRMLVELKSMRTQIQQLEQRLAKGLTVKVSEMPPIRVEAPKD